MYKDKQSDSSSGILKLKRGGNLTFFVSFPAVYFSKAGFISPWGAGIFGLFSIVRKSPDLVQCETDFWIV